MYNKFSEYNLNLSWKNKDLVESYLQEMKEIVDKYDIEIDLYNDIESMVFEKLSNTKTLNQLSITKILKEVWEPKVIFSDYIENTPSNNKTKEKKKKEEKKLESDKSINTPFYENMIKTWWQRDNEWAWILWISKTISEKSSLPIWMIRTLFVIFSFVTISFFAYWILWFLLPKKEIDYKWKTNLWYFKTQLYYFIKDSLTNIVISIKRFLIFIISKSIHFLKITFNYTMKHILPIIRFCFFFFLALFLSMWFISLIILWALYFSNISINNIDYTSVLPDYFIWWIITWIYSIWIFMIAFFLYSVSWKWINKYVIISWFITIIIAIFLWFSTGFHLMQLYSDQNVIKQNIGIEITKDDSKDLILDIHDITNSRNNFFQPYYWTTAVQLINTNENSLSIEIENHFIWNEDIYSRLSGALNEPSLIKNNEEIKIENPKMFSQHVPPTFMRRDINVKVPEWYTIEFSSYAPYLFYVSNAHISENERYKNNVNINCWGKKIWYSKEEEAFVCELSENERNEAKKVFFKQFIIEDFENISPIKHKNEYKRQYWNRDGIYSDWDFWSFYWKDDKTINFEFSDMSLDIRASLDIEEKEKDAIEISNFKINHVEVKSPFKTKYYIDLSPIKDWIWEKYLEEISNPGQDIHDIKYNNINYEDDFYDNEDRYDDNSHYDEIDRY